MSTCNRLDLQTLGSPIHRWLCPKILPDRSLQLQILQFDIFISRFFRIRSKILVQLKNQRTYGEGQWQNRKDERSPPKRTARLRRIAHGRTVAEVLLATNTMCFIDPAIPERAAAVVRELAFAIIRAAVAWIDPTSAQQRRRATWSRGCWRYCKICRCRCRRRRSVCAACSWYWVVRLTWAGAAIQWRVAAVRVFWTTGSWRVSAVGSVCDSASGLRSY